MEPGPRLSGAMSQSTATRLLPWGKVDAAGAKEIDAAGHAITPGFVDIHTHLDAQIGWDPFLTPLSWHGVTTAMMA